ncbi:hypothetical protein [Aeromonas hydrophila]|uniref:hypothetical protein n=1 Tax=Aeromonas hydrophila TaxID=644 RepID=UPI002927AC2E|nr:hypothetical protein [Aeromonas hydrophila]
MRNKQIIAMAELLQQQRRLDYWCEIMRSDDIRLRTLQNELLSLRRNRYSIAYPAVDLPDLLKRCRHARSTRNHATNVIEGYRIQCRQLLDITGITQTLARTR